MNYSDLRSGERIDLRAAIPLARPMTIYIEPTNICNCSCRYCPESFENYELISGGKFVLGDQHFELIAKQIADLGRLETLNFYMMGEPFANKNLLSFVAKAKKYKLAERIIVTSNGSLVNDRIFSAICESGLDYLRISIYGSDESEHREVTQSGVKLSRIKRNIKGLIDYRNDNDFQKPFIYVKKISGGSVSDARFLDLFSDSGDEVIIEPVMNWNDPSEGRLAGVSASDLLEMDYFKIKKNVCPFPFYTLVIHADLNVSVCCVDWNKKLVVGNLRSDTLIDIWTGEKLRALQIKHLMGERCSVEGCNKCTFLHTAPDKIEPVTPEILKRLKN